MLRQLRGPDMTDKQLKQLKKVDLIEILISQDKQIEDLKNKAGENAEKLALYTRIIRKYLLNDLTEEEKKSIGRI